MSKNNQSTKQNQKPARVLKLKDSDTAGLERDVSKMLGVKVSITHNQVQPNDVRIRWQTYDQLDDLLRRLVAPHSFSPPNEKSTSDQNRDIIHGTDKKEADGPPKVETSYKARRPETPGNLSAATLLDTGKLSELFELMADRKAFGLALKKARQDAGLSQTKVAAQMDTSQDMVSAIELGKGNQTIDTLIKYAQTVGLI